MDGGFSHAEDCQAEARDGLSPEGFPAKGIEVDFMIIWIPFKAMIL